jgi:hypothetical protein
MGGCRSDLLPLYRGYGTCQAGTITAAANERQWRTGSSSFRGGPHRSVNPRRCSVPSAVKERGAGTGYRYDGELGPHRRKFDLFCDYRWLRLLSKGHQKANGACMACWSSQCRWLAVAFVALSCSGREAHAFALCDGCPDLFASTLTAPVRQAAPPQQRAQSTIPARHVNRHRDQRRDDPVLPLLGRRTPLTAFAMESAAPSKPTDTTDSSSAVTIANPALTLVAEAAMPATPALRIDELFNIMAAGPSDEPAEVAAVRAIVLAQFLVRHASPAPDNRTEFPVPTLIAFGGGLLLIGAVLVSARRQYGLRNS